MLARPRARTIATLHNPTRTLIARTFLVQLLLCLQLHHKYQFIVQGPINTINACHRNFLQKILFLIVRKQAQKAFGLCLVLQAQDPEQKNACGELV